MRTVRDTLQGMLRPGVALADSPLELERLGLVSSLYKFVRSSSVSAGTGRTDARRRQYRASKTLAMRGVIAYDITQLAACVRAFTKCEKRNRGSAGLGYECESGERCRGLRWCRGPVTDAVGGQMPSGL